MVDIESLKKPDVSTLSASIDSEYASYNQAIDDLKAKGYLRQPLEPVEGLEEVVTYLDSLPDIGETHLVPIEQGYIILEAARKYLEASK